MFEYVPNKYLPIRTLILPMYFSSYACKHYQSGTLLGKFYLELFYEHNEKCVRATREIYVPLEH